MTVILQYPVQPGRRMTRATIVGKYVRVPCDPESPELRRQGRRFRRSAAAGGQEMYREIDRPRKMRLGVEVRRPHVKWNDGCVFEMLIEPRGGDRYHFSHDVHSLHATGIYSTAPWRREAGTPAGREPVTVLALDGYNLLYRSFTSLPSAIVAADGRPIHAVYGLIGSLLRMTRERAASGAVAAFDVPDVPTFRHEIYPDYQGQRGPLGGEHAEEFRRQVSIAQEILPSLGIPVLRKPGFEADDIMATVATTLAADGITVTVVSTDRDVLQLVRPHIEVLSPGNPSLHITDADGVRARMGVGPEAIADLKALAGDPSDNVPGIAGIGMKTAAQLLDRFGTLDGVFANLDVLPTRARNALQGQEERARLFRRVVTLVTDLAIEPAEPPPLRLSPDARIRDILETAGYGRP